jgi:hypothetical protein
MARNWTQLSSRMRSELIQIIGSMCRAIEVINVRDIWMIQTGKCQSFMAKAFPATRVREHLGAVTTQILSTISESLITKGTVQTIQCRSYTLNIVPSLWAGHWIRLGLQ